MPRRAVVTSFDENYLMPGLVAAVSAIEHAPDDAMLAILGVNLSVEALALIETRTPPDRTKVLDAAELIGSLPGWQHISSAAWARVGMASLLTDDIERVVYVDGDSYTRRSLAPLFDMDLEGRTIAAAVERPLPTHRARQEWGRKQNPRHQYGSDSPVPDVYSYFNSGVMAVDLSQWRAREVERRVMEVAAALPPSYFLLDQDALNHVLFDDWLLLDWRRWNWPGFLKEPDAWDANVVHFVASPKPWVSQPLGAPFAREYRRAASAIGWSLEAKTERVKSGIIETVSPHSLVVRRKRVARAIRGHSPDRGPAAQRAVGSSEDQTKSSYGIVVAFDDHYLQPGLVAAHTAIRNAPDGTKVFVLGVELSSGSQKRIIEVLGEHRVEIIEAGEYTAGMPDTMPRAAWARIGIGQLLPEEIERIVYLDSDTMTRASLSPLFDTDLEGRVLAAAIDEPETTHRSRHEWGKKTEPTLDFLADSPVPDVVAYFNSGVLMVDMNAWREDNVGERLGSFAQSMPDSYILPDQDLLNVVLWREWLPVDWRTWNWPGLMLDRLSWETHIAHFKGPSKPWVTSPVGAPFAREYRAAAKDVGWNLDVSLYRIKWGILETVLPHSILLRRRKIGRAVRRSFSGRQGGG